MSITVQFLEDRGFFIDGEWRWLAKTYLSDGKEFPGHDVAEHGRMAAKVAEWLVANYFPGLSEKFPENWDLAMLLHDVGKIGRLFQKSVAVALKLAQFEKGERGRPRMHDLLSYLTVRCLIPAGIGATGRFAMLLGAHHGRALQKMSASDSAFEDTKGRDPSLFRKEREKLVRELLGGRLLPQIADNAQYRLLLGLLVVSDWVASGGVFNDPRGEWGEALENGIRELGFILPSFRKGLSFRDIFGFELNALQSAVLDRIAKTPDGDLFIIEMPTGMGKTELALMIVYILFLDGKVSGLYFGLPTRMTSELIRVRLDAFLRKVVVQQKLAKSVLIHENTLRCDLDDEDGRRFFRGRMSLLAPFAIGTLDQALMAVMRVRHSCVRSLGLAGKAVIIDEAHSYDAYSGYILDELVRSLRDLGAKVIILSATLTPKRREDFLKGSGRALHHPLLTIGRGGSVVCEKLQSPREAERKAALIIAHDEDALLGEVRRRVADGQRVLWIENTVAKSQDVFLKGKGLFDCLIHSRFRKSFRRKLEEKCVELFGKERIDDDRGHAVVGTQMLEQSLDLDADFIIMRICPADMIVQRLGRLWRHFRPNRPCSECAAVVLAPDLSDALENPAKAFGSSGRVYDPYILARTLQALAARSEFRLPGDVPRFLDDVYSERDEGGAMLEARKKASDRAELERAAAVSAIREEAEKIDDDRNGFAPPTRLGRRTETALLIRGSDECGLIDMDGNRLPLVPENRERAARFLVDNSIQIPAGKADFPRQGDLYGRLGKFADMRNLLIARVNEDGTIRGSSQFSYLEEDGLGFFHERSRG